MSQLRPAFILEIKKALEGSAFTVEDFDFEFPKSGKTLIKIGFLYNPQYYFILIESIKREEIKVEERYAMTSRQHTVEETVFTVKTSPGKYKVEDVFEVDEIGSLIRYISPWCDFIRTDLYAKAPQEDPLKYLREKLKKNFEDIVIEPDDYFSPEELDIVDARFDKLFNELSNLHKDHELTKQQIQTLKSELDEFKKSARAYQKGNWAKITGNKLLKVVSQVISPSNEGPLLIQEVRRALGLDEEK